MTSDSPAARYVVDTVALILHLEERSMGSAARQAFADTAQGRAEMYIPAMVLAEILYLTERGRITATLTDAKRYLDEHPQCREAPLDLDVVAMARTITDIPELHDRLIAATAIHLGAPLITNDAKIRASSHLETRWE